MFPFVDGSYSQKESTGIGVAGGSGSWHRGLWVGKQNQAEVHVIDGCHPAVVPEKST